MNKFKPFIFLLAAAFFCFVPGLKIAHANYPDGNGEWADTVFSYLPGTTKDGSAVSAERSDPWQTLGVAESMGLTTNAPYSSGLSLGFGGQVTLKFDNTILNLPGRDLKIYSVDHRTPEIIGKKKYYERVKVQVSQNCWKWYTVGFLTGDGSVDIGPLRWAKCVQLTDVSNKTKFSNSSDGFDLDGVQALHTTADQPWLGKVYDLRWWKIDDNSDNDVWHGINIKNLRSTSFCNGLNGQIVAFHNNWLTNSSYNGVSFQSTYYSTVGSSVQDGTTIAALHEMLETFTCTKYSNRSAANRALVQTLTRINKGQYIWSAQP